LKRHFQNAYAADRKALKVRWALVAFWAILSFGVVDLQTVVLGCGVLALLGWFTHQASRTPTDYEKVGRRAFFLTRLVDATLASAVSTTRFPGAGSTFDLLWLLSIPIILLEALSSGSVKKVALIVAGTALPQLLLGGETVASPADLAVPIAVTAISGAFGLVLSRFQLRQKALEDRDRQLSTIIDASIAVAHTHNLHDLIQQNLQSAVAEVGGTAGMVALLDEERENLIVESVYSRVGSFEFPEQIQLGEGVTGYAVKSGQPFTLCASGTEALNVDDISLPIRSVVSIPLINREFSTKSTTTVDQIIGALTIVNDQTSKVESEDLDLLQSLAALMANAIHNARIEERQRAIFLRTLESLATALEARDDYTRGHSQRVCDLSLFIGKRLGLTSEALEELRVGTILHDIGKIGVPDAILNKPGRLTDGEFSVMRQHPVIGYEICRPLQLSEGVLMIIRNHHEKLDGSGYPDGLRGGELPLSLRIVCVADAFDAMSSRRPYRDVMSLNYVLGEMSKGAGTQFDPVVVEALKEILHSGQLTGVYGSDFRPETDLEEHRRAA